MNKFIKNQKTILIYNLIFGLILLAAGIIFSLNNVKILPDNKAIIALSLMPFGVALSAIINLALGRKKPHSIEKVLIRNNDERIRKIKHKAEAKTLQILSWALSIVFFGYTLSYPSHAFTNPIWWSVFAFMLAPDLLSVMFEIFYSRKECLPE